MRAQTKLISVTHKGKKYLFRDPWDYWAYAEVILADVYRPFQLKKDDVIVDLGANIGLFTVHIADKVKRVISVEPEPSNFHILEQAVMSNRLTNVTILNIAISDRRELVRIAGQASLAKISDSGTPVQADSLDALISSRECANANILKIDIEGHEGIALRAFTGWSNIREIIIEIHSLDLHNEISDLLQRNGFAIRDISKVEYSRIIKDVASHPISFILAEAKNGFFLTRKYFRYLLKIGPAGSRPKPGTGGISQGTSVIYAFNKNYKGPIMD